MRTSLLTALFFLPVSLLYAQRIETGVAGVSPRQVSLMEEGWKFHRGGLPQPLPQGHHWIYKSVKAGAARGPAAFQFDDSSWRTVKLPHDYVVEGSFVNNKELVSHGFRERPEGWYRRQFILSPDLRGKSVWLYFDGVFGQSQVWVNGQELRRNDNGYIGFRVDISDVAHYGDRPNVVAVKCDPREAQGWWYEGGGIYRHVWLTVAEPVHVAPYGVYISADRKQGGAWKVVLETTLENDGEEAAVKVVSTIVDKKGQTIASASKEVSAPAGGAVSLKQNFSVPESKVSAWDVDSPNLYGIRTELFVNGKKVDATGDYFGFRTLEFNADKGFFLNGKPLKLKGVCMHQDHAGVGVALPDGLQDFRVARLKQFGVNAYRCSHNPPAPEILRACDRLGMLVLNENRFFNSSEECLRQLEEQVRRDRNHPSVMMWSTFNEEDWQGDERGVRIARRMKRVIDREDRLARRPVTGAMSAGFGKQSAYSVLDTLGVNYSLGVHDRVHKTFPDKMVYSSESVSHSASRGEWKDGRNIFNNYDNHWVGWGSSIRSAWKHVSSRAWDAGTFIWTGFDYRGEPTPTNDWPVVSSYFGIVDTCGFAKDSFYLLQALWTEKPMAHVFPHWNLGDGMAGKKVKVGVYTNGDEAELILNGKSLGRKKVDPFEQLFLDDVVYQPGTLKLIAYKNGKKWAEDQVSTTGAPKALGLEARFGDWKRKNIRTGVSDAVPVAVYATDEKGRRVPTASNKVRFSITGGRVLGVGNGDPLCREPDAASERSLYNGLACVIIEASPGAKEVELIAGADGLKSAVLRLPVVAREGFPQYPAPAGVQAITDWRLSEITARPQDPNRPIADGDMNTWQTIAVGDGPQPQWADKPDGWGTYRALFDMPGRGEEWTLTLEGVAGRAEVFVNGQAVGKKNTPDKGNISVPVKARPGSKVTVSVQMQGDGRQPGLTGTAKLSPGGK
ncbi:MAG: DUF4982 domain-containing protein [Akkermansiaceae bacterium]|nr:DUF4982 domain-containing protein [Akkermansiaceae bacterium]